MMMMIMMIPVMWNWVPACGSISSQRTPLSTHCPGQTEMVLFSIYNNSIYNFVSLIEEKH